MSEPEYNEPCEPGAVAAPLPWVTGATRLKFLLGEVPLGAVTFPCLTLDAYVTDLLGGPPEPILLFDRFPPAVAVLKAPSYPVPARLPRLSRLPGMIRYVPSQYRRYYVDLAGTFDAYLGRFSSKTRATLRRKVRKFAEISGGEIDWREFLGAEGLDEFHRLAVEVSRRTYQERLLQAGLPPRDRFQQILATSPGARGYLLFVRERPVAYMFCPERSGNLLYQNVGYDPEYQHGNPGTVLLYLVLERLFAEGRHRAFDFTEGEGPHKEFFANQNVFCADIYYFRDTVRHWLLVTAHTGLYVGSRTLARTLGRAGLKDRIKKLVRARSSKPSGTLGVAS
jgi:hypothetical protein